MNAEIFWGIERAAREYRRTVSAPITPADCETGTCPACDGAAIIRRQIKIIENLRAELEILRRGLESRAEG